MLRTFALTAVFAALATTAHAADAAAGKSRFQSDCGLCHSAEPGDDGGGMGPSLHGLAGRPAATVDTAFPYSPALRNSKLVWDAATLSRFLANPSVAVPGTSMPISVQDQVNRDDLVAYFTSLKPPPAKP